MILTSQENIKKYREMGVWTDNTIIDYFKIQANKDPDRICIVDPPNKNTLVGLPPERLTYKEFERAIDATADALLEIGVKKDDVVMVQLPNSWELAMLYFAIAKTGAVVSPAPMLWREAELGYVAGLTEATLFITIEEFNNFSHKELAHSLQSKYPSLKKTLMLQDIREMSKGEITGKTDDIRIDPDDIFTICWTSGTEANSKGCPLSHNNWSGMILVQESAGMKPGDVMITAGPLVNMASVGTVFIPWAMMGGTLVLHHPFDPNVFMQQIMQEKPNYTLLVPAIANMIAKHPKVDDFDLTSFRTITLGSAPLSLWTMKEFKQRWGIEIGNIWGQNEGTGIIAGFNDIPDMETRVDHFPQWGRPGSQWKSKAGEVVEVKVVSPGGEELTNVGDVGELVYKGPGLMAGYYKNPDVTQQSFTEDGFFRTGDLFRIRENSCISFYERAKDIIIRGGYNISSQEVENYLVSHPGVQEAAVVGMPDEKLGERMCAYVVPMQGESISLKDITSYLAEKGIAKYKYPERLEITDALPRNPVGKIVKKRLRDDIKKRLHAE
ncbi:MAG: acyl--CoA ligase [Desulfobacterales bacterium]|nr:acyl--CoA ligase [Desulfobacterales bacterium]